MSNSNKNTNQSNTIKTSGTVGKSFGPGGCQAVTEGRKCGETNSLQIIQEFRRLYETKMKEIDEAAGGDCVQAKINLQQEWIRDLTDQNEMLVRVVEELEVEAAERVIMLEERLQHSANCACEVMGFYENSFLNYITDSKKIEDIQSDLNNIIEVLKQVKQNRTLEFEGLTFNSINIKEILTDLNDVLSGRDCYSTENNAYDKDNIANEKMAKDKDQKIKELEDKIQKLQGIADKNEEAQKTLQQYTELKKSMLDMREALTAEVAEKHDTILRLRRDLFILEEQCRKADQQTHFKDDIIKELRKEIKQLKLQKSKKSRSPRTVKKSDQRPSHLSRIDLESNIHNIKDGTIVIKDSATVGDIATQNIREKYTDPSNQTIVYICESIPQKQKFKHSKQSDVDVSFNQSKKTDEKSSFEVSLDNSCLTKNQVESPEHSRSMTAEMPRDNSNTFNNSKESNYLNYPSMHETCIRYSRDILNMLNSHASDGKNKDMNRNISENYNSIESGSTHKCDGGIQKNISSSFLSDSVNRCEKYFLDMFQSKCKYIMTKLQNLDSTYLGKKQQCYCQQLLEDYYMDIEKYQFSQKSFDQKKFENANVYSKNLDAIVQTVEECIHNKETQTSEIKLCDSTSNIESFDVPEPLYKENNLDYQSSHVTENSYSHSADIKENCQEYIPSPETVLNFIKKENHVSDSCWDNRNVHSNDISFNEMEIRAFSSPFPEDLPMQSQNVYEIQRNMMEVYPDQHFDSIRSHRAHGICEVPLVPVQHCIVPHKIRKQKILSPKTVCNITRPQSIPLSIRHSLPACTNVHTNQNLHRPMRLRKLKKRNCSKAECDFIDVPLMVDERDLHRNILTNEVQNVNNRCGVNNKMQHRRVFRGDYFIPRMNLNNTH